MSDTTIDDAAAIQAQLDQTGEAILPAGTFHLARPLVLQPDHRIVGAGRSRTRLLCDPGVGAIRCEPARYTEGPLHLRDFAIVGDLTTAPDLVLIRRVSGIVLSGLSVRNTPQSCIRIDGMASNLALSDTRLEDFGVSGLWLRGDEGPVNVWSVQVCDFSTNVTSGWAALRVQASGYGQIRACNFEGLGRVRFGLFLDAVAGVEVTTSFFEKFADAAIALDGRPSSNVLIARNHLHPRIDLNAHRLAHVNVRVEDNRTF